MMPQQSKRRLGRGLAALIGEDAGEDAIVRDSRALKHVPIEHLKANPNNPRKQFKDEDLEDLARSIREKGLLQPIVVRPHGDDGGYEIVAGERRWRAAQRAGVYDVPVLVRDLTDGEALEVALIENIQRADLNALEEARGYRQLLEQFNYTQQQLADSLAKSRSHIANTLRLLTLPDNVRGLIEDGSLTAGHARALIAAASPGELAEQIIKLGLNVRETERLSREKSDRPSRLRARRPGTADANIKALETSLLEATGLKVEISDEPGKGGKLILHYKTLEQLDDLCRRLGAAQA
jgi:ParB family chromosome partitioning protein